MILADITRKQAFLTHLAVSSCVFFVISYLIVFHWFPDYYFFLDGGVRAITTIFIVDVVLGPGLTLLVFKPGKKGLKVDMVIILLVQLSALTWGIKSAYEERPGATVFYLGQFTCITQSDTHKMNMPPIIAGPSGRQRLAFLQRPDTIDEVIEFTKEAFSHRSSAIYYYGEKIVPLDERVINRLSNYQFNLLALASENEVSAGIVKDYIDHHKNQISSIQLMPLSCRYGSKIAVYDMHELKIVDLIDVQTGLSAEAQDEPLPLKSQISN